MLVLSIAEKSKRLMDEMAYAFSIMKPRKLLFDHLPKCGGSAFTRFLASQYLERKVFSINGCDPLVSVAEFKSLPQRKRYGYDLVAGHGANHLLDFVHPDCFKLTVLRDPVDRIVSYYYYAKSEKAHYLYQQLKDSGMSLDEFAVSSLTTENRNYFTCHFLGVNVAEAEKAPDESIAKAVDVVRTKYDAFGFLDQLDLFADTIYHLASFKGEHKLAKTNVTKERLTIDAVSASTLKKIEDVNFLDVAFCKALRGMDGVAVRC